MIKSYIYLFIYILYIILYLSWNENNGLWYFI